MQEGAEIGRNLPEHLTCISSHRCGALPLSVYPLLFLQVFIKEVMAESPAAIFGRVIIIPFPVECHSRQEASAATMQTCIR